MGATAVKFNASISSSIFSGSTFQAPAVLALVAIRF